MEWKLKLSLRNGNRAAWVVSNAPDLPDLVSPSLVCITNTTLVSIVPWVHSLYIEL